MVAEIIKSWRESPSPTSEYRHLRRGLDSSYFKNIGFHLLLTGFLIGILSLTGGIDSVEGLTSEEEIWDTSYIVVICIGLLWIPLDEFLLRAYLHARKFLWYSGAAAALFFVATILLDASLQEQVLAAGLLLFLGSLAVSKRLYDWTFYSIIGSALYYAGIRLLLLPEHELGLSHAAISIVAIQLVCSGIFTGITHLRHGFWLAVLHRTVVQFVFLLLMLASFWIAN
ncbi:hypothetical protein A3SI_12224 [Nitritalea halalkaliphila LW7]|uniref:Uncharacterized protein n=1 Tax=Nitritalea halalkaliphila LW7 TaxID=1189621 RepID=I5C1W0_9BACT|nr:hypothetical protein [Nitritalea halalkaliphila]EIM75812.1 hypothetical protein A3SI_12224 [Nitritalea halalkaliphila LW7]